MLNLVTESINELSDRLNTTLTGGNYYLFEFIHKTTNKKFYIVVTASNVAVSSVQFDIDTNTFVLPVGDFDYYVYLQVDNINLNPVNTIGRIKQDIARVRSNAASGDVFYTLNDNQENIYYGG